MKKTWKRLCTGFLALATVVTALPTTPVHAESKQYWTETGENHVVVTDDNGQFSTSAEWASHKHNTNAGKTSEDGVWFGTSEPDDSKGALPYDTYIIEEMRCDSNKGFELIPPFEIVVSRNNLVIDLGTLTDEYEKEISIHTTATSKDGEKTILAGKEVTIVDTVKLDGLTKGSKYQLKGWQMLKEENAELVIDGKRVENDYMEICSIQCQFDCKLKRVVKGIVRNYRKELKRRRNKEISYCELPEIVVEKLAVWDEYESDYTAFDVCGIEVRVLDDDLAKAIKYLSEKDREILLMYFFLGMSDTEIGDRLKINRSTSFRSRKNSLEEIKKKLKENMNDE